MTIKIQPEVSYEFTGPCKVTASHSTRNTPVFSKLRRWWWGLSASSVTFMKFSLMTGFISLLDPQALHLHLSSIFFSISPPCDSWMRIGFFHSTTGKKKKKSVSILFKIELQLCFILTKARKFEAGAVLFLASVQVLVWHARNSQLLCGHGAFRLEEYSLETGIECRWWHQSHNHQKKLQTTQTKKTTSKRKIKFTETQFLFHPKCLYTLNVFRWMAELALSSHHPALVLF